MTSIQRRITGLASWKNISTRLAAALAATLLIPACSQNSDTPQTGNSIVARQELYRNLLVLETGLYADYEARNVTPEDPQSAFRDLYLLPAAEFEVSRNRRNLAFEQLADTAAPEESADDFAAFWEIHQAYRFAVQSSRHGHGKVSLVYARPYPGDHLSGPLAQLSRYYLDAVSGRQQSLPEDTVDTLARALDILTQRLDLDLSAGLAPPPSVINRMLTQIEESPFSDRAKLVALRSRLRSDNANPDTTINPALADLASFALFEPVQSLKAQLETIRDIQTSAAEPPTRFSKAFLNAVIAQSSSGHFTAESCAARAQQFQDDTLTRIDRAIYAAEQALSAETESGTPVTLSGNTLSAKFIAWQALAPLFPPDLSDPETVAQAEPPAPAQSAPGVAPSPPASVQFSIVETGLSRLRPAWGALSPKMLPDYDVVEIGLANPAPMQNQPARPVGLSEAGLDVHIEGQRLEIASPDLARLPPSLAIIDIMSRTYPGHAFPEAMKENLEYIPELSRSLPNAAFELGWPYFALLQLDERNAFADTPRLEVAMLYRRLQIFADANITTRYLAGAISRDTARAQLQTILNISENEASDIIDRASVEPGLSCAALSGFTRFEALKSRAEGVLGNRFNIRDFNEIVLSPGSRPLALVEHDVDSWLADQVETVPDTNLPQ